MNVHYVTSNLRKFQEASYIFRDSKEWNLVHTPLEIEEIQGSPRDIAHHKAQLALMQLQAPLIVEDVSFSCAVLGGLPGPYVKDFLRLLGPAGIARLISQLTPFDDVVEVSCHTVYIAPGQVPIYSVGKKQGQVVPFRDPSGQHSTSWNGIYLQKGESRTFSEMTIEEISQISMRHEALISLVERYRHVCT